MVRPEEKAYVNWKKMVEGIKDKRVGILMLEGFFLPSVWLEVHL
jgi:hypothetical protein